MATLNRFRVGWVGVPVVGGGVSTFYSESGDVSVFNSALRAFFVAAGPHVATGVVWTFPASGDTIDEATGEINGSWSAPVLSNVNASGSSNWAAGVGCRVVWSTAGITRGRRVKGSTYVVPLGANLYDGTGTIAAGVLTDLTNAGNTLRAADGASMRVYTRPNTALGASGAGHAVTAASAPDAVTWLRSRRV